MTNEEMTKEIERMQTETAGHFLNMVRFLEERIKEHNWYINLTSLTNPVKILYNGFVYDKDGRPTEEWRRCYVANVYTNKYGAVAVSLSSKPDLENVFKSEYTNLSKADIEAIVSGVIDFENGKAKAATDNGFAFGYYGLSLSRQDRDAYRTWGCGMVCGKHNDYITYADECVLLRHDEMGAKGSVQMKQFLDLNVGRRYEIKVVAIGKSDKCIALRVKLPKELRLCDKQYDILLCTFSGGKPKSVEKIKSWEYLNNPETITATLMKI